MRLPRRKFTFLRGFLVFILIIGWIFSGWPQIWKEPPIPPKIQEVQAATTGEKYPTLGESVSEAPWSDNAWTTPTNIYADDAATANVTPASFDTNDQTYVLKATGFDFSVIPDGSTINGVIARVNSWYRSGEGSGSMDLCQLLDTSKAKVGTNQCATPVALTTTDTTIITKGSSTDTWGNSLTTAWVKNANFGIALGILATAANADVDIDYVILEIYYTPPAGTLTVDIVDADGNPVASPSMAMGAVNLSFSFQTANGTFGVSTEKIRVENTTANPQWNLTIAANGGSTAFWDGATSDYDFNDPTANAGDGGDADSLGGQMTIDASGGTLGGTCSATDITKGSSASFSEGVTDSITLLTAGASADTSCYWDFTGVSVSQTIPAEQLVDSYSINMTLTVTAL